MMILGKIEQEIGSIKLTKNEKEIDCQMEGKTEFIDIYTEFEKIKKEEVEK